MQRRVRTNRKAPNLVNVLELICIWWTEWANHGRVLRRDDDDRYPLATSKAKPRSTVLPLEQCNSFKKIISLSITWQPWIHRTLMSEWRHWPKPNHMKLYPLDWIWLVVSWLWQLAFSPSPFSYSLFSFPSNFLPNFLFNHSYPKYFSFGLPLFKLIF